jgi:hypothetical protein
MTSKQYNPADYAAAGFLSIKKEEQRQAAVFFLANRLLGKILQAINRNGYRLSEIFLQHMGESDISA